MSHLDEVFSDENKGGAYYEEKSEYADLDRRRVRRSRANSNIESSDSNSGHRVRGRSKDVES